MLTVEQRIFLARSKEFQKLLNEDPYLDELNRSRYDHAAEFFSLMEMLRNTFTVGNVTVQPLTPALWAFLWGIGNTYTGDVEKITEPDTDIFLYLLANGVRNLDCEVSELPAKASGFCASHGLDYPTAALELVKMIHLAFRPLEMLPKVEASADHPMYDADWLARLCATAASEANEKATEIMFTMPLSACCYFFVNALRKNDTKGWIRRRTNDEVSREIVLYVDSLGERFAAEHFGKD